MATLADYFNGNVTRQKYAQIFCLEYFPVSTTVDGVPVITTYVRNLYTASFESRSYSFEGIPVSMIDSLPASVTVTDVGGASHTVYLSASVTDGSSGSAAFEKDKNAVNIRRISPHMCAIDVTRTIGSLACNGVTVIAAPSW